LINVACIVEGDGEVAALPVLLRRICEWQTPESPARIPTPIRVYKDRFLNRDGEFRRHLLLAAAKCEQNGWVLVLLDADDDCPAARGAEILERARAVIPHRHISVVLANREYEAWFIAAAQSLDGMRNFVLDNPVDAVDPEIPRNAKGWLARRMGGAGYNETTDQPAFSARMDLQQAFDASRSFKKLCSEWLKHHR
jgi:hypothetical protein